MLTVVIQAGGESSRMGTNKAIKPFMGVPLIERVIHRVELVADQIVVVTNLPDAYPNLEYPLIPDVKPGTGALGGLLTALVHAKTEFVANVACDMPFVSAPLLNFFLDLITEDISADVIIPRTQQGYEPMHAIYRRETCLPAVEESLQNGRRRMISWFEKVQVRSIPQAVLARFDPQERAFINVNTPADFKTAEALAKDTAG